LAVGSAVSGRAARLACEHASESFQQRSSTQHHALAPRNVCGTIVRLFKYLMSDYYSDYFANLQDMVQQLSTAESSPARLLNLRKWQELSILYGEGVIPPGVLFCLNGGLDEWSHNFQAESAAPAPGSAALSPASASSNQPVYTSLQDVQQSVLKILRDRILVVDEHPTLTRMFTCAPHVECLLLLHFLGLLPTPLKFRGTEPQAKNQKRVTKVSSFVSAADTPQYLKRTSLALQILGQSSSLCSATP